MNRTIFIIGTDHRYQNKSSDFTELQHEMFIEFLYSCFLKSSFAIVAEENNLKELIEQGLEESVVRKFAADNSRPHLYCEADRDFRMQNGMELENGLRASGFINNLTDEEIEKNIQKSFRARESHWLKQIVRKDLWPVLFICGADHVIPFRDLVDDKEIKVVMLVEDWGN